MEERVRVRVVMRARVRVKVKAKVQLRNGRFDDGTEHAEDERRPDQDQERNRSSHSSRWWPNCRAKGPGVVVVVLHGKPGLHHPCSHSALHSKLSGPSTNRSSRLKKYCT